MRVMIATHGNLADGVKSNLSLFVDTSEVECVNAYLTDEDYTPAIEKFINDTKDDEVSFIFTDLLGGSVNQKVMCINTKDNVKIIAGFNISLILEIMVSKITSDEEIERAIEMAGQQIQLVQVKKMHVKEISDDDFLD